MLGLVVCSCTGSIVVRQDRLLWSFCSRLQSFGKVIVRIRQFIHYDTLTHCLCVALVSHVC